MSALITPPNFTSFSVRAFFTSRKLAGINAQLDEVLAADLGISKSSIYIPVQKHTGNVHVLDGGLESAVADAVITRKKNIFIGVVVADCVPILLYDPVKEAAGAVHAGWRGTAKGILKNTIEAMKKHYGTAAEDIRIAIGPSIRACSYEVGKDVKEEVQKATGAGDYYNTLEDRYMIDLSSANKIQAMASGVGESGIWQSEDCTFCNPDKYYSYRHAGGSTGRQGGFIGMW